MQKEASRFALIVGLGFLVMSGCGGLTSSLQSSSTGSATPTGSIALFGSDYPVCDVLSFQATITGATVTPVGGAAPVSILSSGQSITVDFARLVNFRTLLNFSNVPTGSYDQLTITLSDPQLTVLDTSQSPPAPVQVTTTLTTSTPTVSIDPVLVVSTNTTSGLLLDFNLRKSVQTDANGQVTGTVDPVIEASATNWQSGQTDTSVGKIDNLTGIVQSVTTSSSDPAFTGSFTLQSYGGIGPIFTIYVTSSTTYSGVTDLSGLSTAGAGTYVEVDGYVDGKGSIIAEYVEVEDQISTTHRRRAYLGQVIGVTYDSTGNATQFTLLRSKEFPFRSYSGSSKAPLTVVLTSDTRYRITGIHMFWPRWHPPDPADFAFGPASVGVGQEVAVHATADSDSSTTRTARAVYLRPQTILGNFTALLASGSDGKTGGFTMQPCGLVFQGKPIPTLTFASTHFSGGISDLTGLTAQPTLAVRGTIFYQQTSGTLNGASWTAPTLVDQAAEVHQLK